jgi:hypothetical protein
VADRRPRRLSLPASGSRAHPLDAGDTRLRLAVVCAELYPVLERKGLVDQQRIARVQDVMEAGWDQGRPRMERRSLAAGVIVQGQANGEWTPFALQTLHTFAAAGTIHLACSDNNGATHWQVTRLRIQATRVDQITQSP